MVMKHNKERGTTVCVDCSIRDRINQEADRLGLSQREMVVRLIEAYEKMANGENNQASPSDEQSIKINESIEKILKRDDRIVAFIKEQEKILLSPILQGVQKTQARIDTLIDILKNIE